MLLTKHLLFRVRMRSTIPMIPMIRLASPWPRPRAQHPPLPRAPLPPGWRLQAPRSPPNDRDDDHNDNIRLMIVKNKDNKKKVTEKVTYKPLDIRGYMEYILQVPFRQSHNCRRWAHRHGPGYKKCAIRGRPNEPVTIKVKATFSAHYGCASVSICPSPCELAWR